MRWPPYQHVIFDCDSTLTQVEGIDVLAANAGRADEVTRLTAAAMDGEMDLEDVYGERLRAVDPTRADVLALRQAYKDDAVPDASAVVSALLELGHEVYVVSGGLYEPVREFGVALGVPADNIRAVGVEYDQLAGEWWSPHQAQERYLAYGEGALAMSQGKAQIVNELTGHKAGRRMLIGDGTSDLLAAGSVELFVGFGGVAVRPKVRAGAPVFLTELSLSPVVVLAAGPAARGRLPHQAQRQLFDQGTAMAAAALWNDRELADAFAAAVSAVDKV
ncbi:MAG: HAD-IB family phosphatase [Acidimicrobiia bacterium]|nr:HAD-IB family phosphatase [Acidimicrobiia bacterium]MDH3471697.1 HAD-IB family phosphatase [Acidimicrobiia bacterium]